jgi:hypothetical protein
MNRDVSLISLPNVSINDLTDSFFQQLSMSLHHPIEKDKNSQLFENQFYLNF